MDETSDCSDALIKDEKFSTEDLANKLHVNCEKTYTKFEKYFDSRGSNLSNDFFFIFEGCIPLRVLLQSFLGSVNRNCTFRMFFIITVTYPLHVTSIYIYIYIYIYIHWLHIYIYTYIYSTWRWLVGAETCSGYVIVIIKTFEKYSCDWRNPKRLYFHMKMVSLYMCSELLGFLNFAHRPEF
jgi:hypothetical protein